MSSLIHVNQRESFRREAGHFPPRAFASASARSWGHHRPGARQPSLSVRAQGSCSRRTWPSSRLASQRHSRFLLWVRKCLEILVDNRAASNRGLSFRVTVLLWSERSPLLHAHHVTGSRNSPVPSRLLHTHLQGPRERHLLTSKSDHITLLCKPFSDAPSSSSMKFEQLT